jgi:hypothetical protein
VALPAHGLIVSESIMQEVMVVGACRTAVGDFGGGQ